MADSPHRTKAFSSSRAWTQVALLTALLPASALAAAPPPATEPRAALTWTALPAAASAAFDAGPGRALASRARGLRSAAAAVRGDLEALDLSSRWDRDFSGPAGHELNLDAVIVWRLGGGASARRAAWSAEATARDAERALERFDFTLEASRRFVSWWERQALADHVREHLDAQARFLAPARAAAAQQLLSRLLLSDLEVELARLEVEATARDGEAAIAAQGLAALLGQGVRPSGEGLESLDHASALPPNPWPAVATRLGAHPELAHLDAATAAARAEALAADAQGPARLQLGAGFRQTGSESSWGGLLLGLSLPLDAPGADEAARLRADALAHAETRAWRLRALQADVEALAARYDGAASRHARIASALVGPMAERVDLYERAVLAGRADLEQLIRARRDLLEAHHDLVHATAEVLGHAAHAAAMTALLAPPAPGDRP